MSLVRVPLDLPPALSLSLSLPYSLLLFCSILMKFTHSNCLANVPWPAFKRFFVNARTKLDNALLRDLQKRERERGRERKKEKER